MPILPPKVGVSKSDFTVERLSNGQKAIRYGFHAIRGVGGPLAEALEHSRPSSLGEMLNELPGGCFNERQIQNLIHGGALDHLSNRGTLLIGLAGFIEAKREYDFFKTRKQITFLDSLPPADLTFAPNASSMELLKNEKHVLEIAISGHPVDACIDLIESQATAWIGDIDDSFSGKQVVLAGILEDIKQITTKKGDTMAFAELQDATSGIEVIMFPQVFEHIKDMVKPFIPVFIKGNVEYDHKNDCSKLIVNEIKPVLEGRQVIYINGTNVDLDKLNLDLKSDNGVTEVVVVDKTKLMNTGIKVRLNKTVLSKLGNYQYYLNNK